MSTGDFYDYAFLKPDYKRQWVEHLLAGKLYRQIDPDYRGWNLIPMHPMMFIGFKPQNWLIFLDGEEITMYILRPEKKPEDYWERVL